MGRAPSARSNLLVFSRPSDVEIVKARPRRDARRHVERPWQKSPNGGDSPSSRLPRCERPTVVDRLERRAQPPPLPPPQVAPHLAPREKRMSPLAPRRHWKQSCGVQYARAQTQLIANSNRSTRGRAAPRLRDGCRGPISDHPSVAHARSAVRFRLSRVG